VLFQPGATRNRRVIDTDLLFEPGRSFLTPLGQTRLDEIGRWCKSAGRPNSHFVIAAFTDQSRNQDLAEVLTQEQAESVRDYLVQKHGIQSAGWFKTRKIAAVGFGTHAPPSLEPEELAAGGRRVEVILFTPRA
jgi:phospholipid/cholesterol/gamma-HCH transport system substrate-binding protein